MRIPAQRRRRQGLSMTSLIDIIFLLLLFFMLTSTFVRHQQVDIAAPAPKGATGGQTPDVLLRAEAEGVVSVNGQTLPLPEVLGRLTELHQAGGRSLLVKASEGAESQTLVSAVEAARRAGFTKVSVAD